MKTINIKVPMMCEGLDVVIEEKVEDDFPLLNDSTIIRVGHLSTGYSTIAEDPKGNIHYLNSWLGSI